MIKNILYVLTIMLAATFCRAQENQVGTFHFIMAHDDYHERRPDLGLSHPLNTRFKGENYIGFQNKIYFLERNMLKEIISITEYSGRNLHFAHKFLPSFDLFILLTDKLFIYNFGSNEIVFTDSVSPDIKLGRYSRFYLYNDALYYSNDLASNFINLKTLTPSDIDLQSNYLDYFSDGSAISLNLFPFWPTIYFSNDSIYGYRNGERYLINQSISWPPDVTIEKKEGRQKIEVSNDHLLLLVKWLTGKNTSTGQYSIYNKLKEKWSYFKLPNGSPIRYQNGWLVGAYYEDGTHCSTTVNLNQYGEPQNLEEPFFARYTLKYGLWPNLKAMFCQHFIYHVDSESMGVVNLDDHDSEILYVFDDRVVYRIYDRILEAPIHYINTEIQVDRRSEKLLVQDEDIVPNIHYMYVNSQE